MTRLPIHADAREAVPRARGFDNSLALLTEGYRFVSRRCEALGSDVFATRLMLRRVLCVRGEAAARMFYQPGRFTRRRAMPPTALTLLQDVGSAFMLDGEMHRKRKAMVMSLFGPAERQRLVALAEAGWRARFAQSPQGANVNLHETAQAVLCEAACRWAGIPLGPGDAARRTAEFAAMIDGAGAVGPRNWRAQFTRRRTERWARALIDAVRAGRAQPAFDSALNVIARHRDAQGELIDRKHAAVELINLLRPTVAVARYIVFGLLAMHEHPASRARIADGDDDYLGMFTQEVRRYYPFFPATGGRALHDFEWRGLQVAKGTWVLLDLYGTDHHPALWDDPDVFQPERFAGGGHRENGSFDLIPQGGGDPYAGHRCAGESVTVELVKSALRLFATEVAYEVPPQDLSISLRRMPTLPASGMLISGVKPLA